MVFECCNKQSLVNFDWTYFDLDTRETAPRIHRVCSACWTRWLSNREGEIEKLTGKEWDFRLKVAFSSENI